jgi:ring-1,2-phenylacetyl-CoA epoxidase subunit PaaE
MSQSIHLKVREIVQETADTVTIKFWQPIHQAIGYKAGQFLTVIVEIAGKKHRRSYSMSSSPREGALAISVKKVYNGLVSNYLVDHVKVGDSLEVLEPMGNFTLEAFPSQTRSLVFVAGGSGITPIISMIRTVLPAEPNSKLYLIYGSRNEEGIIFKKELDQLELDYPAQLKVMHVLTQPSYTWTGYKSRINQASMVTFLKQDLGITDLVNSQYYMCGPTGMMDEVLKSLSLFNVPSENIHKESFVTHAGQNTDETVTENTGSSNFEITINYEGKTHTLEVKPSETILEAALKLDIDLPYSCQAGMCTACLGKCTSGEVSMDEEDGLTDAEIKQGYILTCVAHPKTAGVVIEIE